MKRARFVAAARHEFLAEVVYYNKEEPGLGARFAAAVEDATARALSFPLSGSPATNNTRRVFLKDFPFAVVYRPETGGITIFAFAHHSRRRVLPAIACSGPLTYHRSRPATPPRNTRFPHHTEQHICKQPV